MEERARPFSLVRWWQKVIPALETMMKTTEIGLLSCGAGAGLAAAFNAPLAGIMFVLEEIHHTFDRTMLVAGLIATVCADFVSKIFLDSLLFFVYDIDSCTPLLLAVSIAWYFAWSCGCRI